MDREQVALSLVLLQLRDGRQLLQWNRHLGGYNFLGGHIEEGETPRHAAMREVREELDTELAESWRIEKDGQIPEAEWRQFAESLESLGPPRVLPFYSARARAEDKPPERTARVHFFCARIDDSLPGLEQRLRLLQGADITASGGESRKLCAAFTARELAHEAWANRVNPFLRLAVKAGLVTGMTDDTTPRPYLLDVAALEAHLQSCTESLLGNALGAADGEALDLRIAPPPDALVRDCRDHGVTVTGTFELRWTGSEQVLSVPFPWPVHGVFILGGPHSRRFNTWAWRPHLTPRLGAWPVRAAGWAAGEAGAAFVRVGFPGLRSLSIPVEPEARRELLRQWRKSPPSRGRLLAPGVVSGELPGGTSPGGETDGSGPMRRWSAAFIAELERVAEQAYLQAPMDESDLGHQRLYTYSAHLIERLLTGLARVLTAVRDPAPQALWERICGAGDLLEAELFSWKWLRSRALVVPFRPINGLDALSQLTALERRSGPPKVLDHLAPVYRQNHPSYRGLICPVDSPESTRVGLTLHLANGARCDVLGHLHATQEDGDDGELGLAASLVPFYQFNDGARCMMGAKNMKQAVPVTGAEAPAIGTGRERALLAEVAPLQDLGLCPPSDAVAPGKDLLVAYMPWHGSNIDDAIVASSAVVTGQVLDWEFEESHSEYVLPGFTPEIPGAAPGAKGVGDPAIEEPGSNHVTSEQSSNTPPPVASTIREQLVRHYFDQSTGLRKPGPISPGSEIVRLVHPMLDEALSVRCGGEGPGELVEVAFDKPVEAGSGGRLRWRIKHRVAFGVGDKLMGRHGNKGIVGAVVPADELPRIPNDPGLPAGIRGRRIDLVLNPHGVVSRMNLGQLLETQLGLLARIAPTETSKLRLEGRPFGQVDIGGAKALCRDLAERYPDHLDAAGRMKLELPDGTLTASPVVVGWQHFVRLRHVPGLKAQARGMKDANAPYSLITGQPVGGRRRRGGLRIGEMEIWALAAHQAGHALESIVGVKSDAAFAGRGRGAGQTFAAIADHLYALGVELCLEDGRPRMHWVKENDIRARGTQVVSKRRFAPAIRATFRCGVEGCGFAYPRRILASGKAERAKAPVLTVRDVLAADDLKLPPDDVAPTIPAAKDGPVSGTAIVELVPTAAGARARVVRVRYERAKGGELTVEIQLEKQEPYPYAWTIVSYKQTEEAMPLSAIAEMRVSCPHHRTRHLEAARPRSVVVPYPGGLWDDAIFGHATVTVPNEARWGFIELKTAVPHPLAPAGTDRPLLKCVPVLPLKYRLRLLPTRPGQTPVPVDQLTAIYAELLEGGDEKAVVQTVGRLMRLLRKRVTGKPGLIRRAGLGRRVDGSARLVIVPDPDLDWDQVGVPCSVLATLLKDEIEAQPELLDTIVKDKGIDRLVGLLLNEMPETPSAPDWVREEVMSGSFWQEFSLLRPDAWREHLALVRHLVEQFLEKRPGFRVLLNRQPSLHRYSMMTLRPVPLPPEDGLVLKINPLVCRAFGADFDGDEMSLHVLATAEEQDEARALDPTCAHNLLSAADGEPLASFDQDFVIGHYLLSRSGNGAERLGGLLARHRAGAVPCSTCEELLARPAPWFKDHGDALMRHFCTEHPDDAGAVVPAWLRLAVDEATGAAVSFGFFETWDAANTLQSVLASSTAGRAEAVELAGRNDAVEKATLNHLHGSLSGAGIQSPGFGLAAMAVSGARGTKQVRQLVAERGYLAPGTIGFEAHAERFLIPQPLVCGMNAEEAFWAAMNSRSSMVDKKLSTGSAGALCRRLVLVGWEWLVAGGDCGAPGSRGPGTCLWIREKRICEACYGPVAGYDSLAGYPAGLIAAQSFGERGTQLSMQSFHTGTRQLSIGDIAAVLEGCDPYPGDGLPQGYNWFTTPGGGPAFVERIRREKAYARLDERHLLMIWTMISSGGAASLSDAWVRGRAPVDRLVGPRQWDALCRALDTSAQQTVTGIESPFWRLLLSRSPAEADAGEAA